MTSAGWCNTGADDPLPYPGIQQSHLCQREKKQKTNNNAAARETQYLANRIWLDSRTRNAQSRLIAAPIRWSLGFLVRAVVIRIQVRGHRRLDFLQARSVHHSWPGKMYIRYLRQGTIIDPMIDTGVVCMLGPSRDPRTHKMEAFLDLVLHSSRRCGIILRARCYASKNSCHDIVDYW